MMRSKLFSLFIKVFIDTSACDLLHIQCKHKQVLGDSNTDNSSKSPSDKGKGERHQHSTDMPSDDGIKDIII